MKRLLVILLLISGCSHGAAPQDTISFESAHTLFSAGNYPAALNTYGLLLAQDPARADRALFEMGILHAYPKNDRKDYGKAVKCFEKIISEHPDSQYRQNSEMMLFSLGNGAVKDKTIASLQEQIGILRQNLAEKDGEIASRDQRVASLEKLAISQAMKKGSIDRILIEKQARRLMLIAHGTVLKSYRIALGGNPVGPKERQGDNKTPEGIYTIDAHNRDSAYHRSLRISYPNGNDMKRARELGVAPGGDIMIHGIKNGFSWVGDGHTEFDWTQGCIAVTDEEIEEIIKVAPIGTVVEIRP